MKPVPFFLLVPCYLPVLVLPIHCQDNRLRHVFVRSWRPQVSNWGGMRKLADSSHLSVLKPEALLVPDCESEPGSKVLSREVSTSVSGSL